MEKTKKRSEIEDKYKWDLEKTYKNIIEVDFDINKYNNIVDKMVEFKGKILITSQSLYDFYILNEEADKLIEKLYVYSHMKCDEDTTAEAGQSLKMKIDKICEEGQEKLSFIVPEILEKDYSVISKYIEENPKLSKYKFDLEKIFRFRNHILNEEQEELLAKATSVMGIGDKVFYNLDNTDIKYGNVLDDNDQLIELTNSNYSNFMLSKSRRVRENAFNAMYNYWESIKNTVSTTLSGRIKENIFLSKIRQYDNPLQSSLYGDNIDVNVYDNLIETVHKNLDKLHNYMNVRKSIMKLDEIHMYDIYVDLVDGVNENINFEEGKNIIFEALKPLGDEYLRDLKKAFTERWIDIYPNHGKKSGAYSWGCYETPPYLLLNYINNSDSVSTMAHELGHSMHSYYSIKNQDYLYSSYPIFLAEIASTVNEMLLNEYLYNKADSREEKIFYITEFLDKIRTTLYRQTMFAEFEKIMHEKEKDNISLTEKEFSDTYYDLNKLYYGENVISDELIRYEWEKIPHFYNSFYVYKYATGISAAVAIVSDILNNKSGIKEKYLEFLSSGGNDYPLDILKKLGVDMTSEEPVQKCLDMFEDKLNELKILCDLK